jgi:sec-independent protein translocase protein TatB
MFGIGFTELMLISIVAILFLGPDKLPGALVDMAKFIKSVKKTVSEAKSSLEEEMKIADLKDEALNYKKQLTDATDELKNFKNINFDDEDDVSYDEDVSEHSPMAHVASAHAKKDPLPEDAEAEVETKQEESVSIKKKPKKEKLVKKEKKISKEKLAKNDKSQKKGEA